MTDVVYSLAKLELLQQTQPIVVTLDDNHSHGFSCGDYVTFKEVKGMTYLNGTVHRIVKNSHSSFQIDSVPNYEYCDYLGGGRCQEVKLPILMSFVSCNL